MRGLKSLGVPLDSYGALLVSALLNKLPSEVRLIISRGMPEEDWDLDQLLGLLESEIIARERATAVASNNQFKKNGPVRHPPTAGTFATSTSTNCIYCGQEHSSKLCTTVPTLEGRRQVLRQTRRCYVCLRQNHISRNCRSSNRCSRCNGKHHVSVCPRMEPTESQKPTPSIPATPSTPSPVMVVNTRTQVLLQTATMVIHGDKKLRPTHRVRTILDCGSQRTYMTCQVQEILSLPTTSVEMIDIKTFGSSEGGKQLCNVVEFCAIARDGHTIKMSALVVPYICEAVYSQSPRDIAKQYSHLKNLDLADSGENEETATMQLLIGSDFYWTLVSGHTQRGDTGPIAIETRFGWVLSGPVDSQDVNQVAKSQVITGLVSTHVLTTDTMTESENLQADLR